MIRTPRLFLAATAALALAATGCATDPTTGEQSLTRGGKGALAGAAGGALIGGAFGGGKGAAIGAAVTALAGGAVGGYMDKQARELKQRTAGTGIEVQQQGNEIKLEMPSAVTFDFNSAQLKPQFMPALNTVAQTLASYQSTYVAVNGYTDSVGSDAYNLKLSQQRAQAVADYLTGNGVNPARVVAQGYGKANPVATNDTDAGRAENRRVEIKLTPITEQNVGTPPGK